MTTRLQAFGEFYNLSTDHMEVMMALVKPKHGTPSLIISAQLLAEIERLDHTISNLTIAMNDGRLMSYSQVQSNSSNFNFLFYVYKVSGEEKAIEKNAECI